MVRLGLKQSGLSLVLNTRTLRLISAGAESTTQHRLTVKLGDGGKISGESITRLFASLVRSCLNSDDFLTRAVLAKHTQFWEVGQILSKGQWYGMKRFKPLGVQGERV